MMKRLRKVWFAVGVVALVGACNATDVGNPQDGARDAGDERVDVHVGFEGLKRAPDPSAIVLPGGTEVQAVWVGVSRPGLRRRGRCAERADSAASGTFVVDLLAESGDRKLELADRPVGTYCGFDVELDQVSGAERPSGAPEALAGRSVLVVGERRDGTRFEIRGEFEFELSLLRHGTGFAVDAEQRDLLASFAMGDWIETAALEEIQGEAPIVVGPERHPEVFEPFRESFDEQVLLLRDADANGRSDPSERREILASTLPEDERMPDDDDREDEERGDAGEGDID